MNLEFLKDFHQLNTLEVYQNEKLGSTFYTFPNHLPSLSMLKISDCIGWNDLKGGPLPIIKAEVLKIFFFTGAIDFNDELRNVIMDWTLESFGSTLEALNIYKNNLTRVPEQIKSFPGLTSVDLSRNYISNITSGSFVLHGNGVSMYITDCGVEDIEPFAFSGTLFHVL